MDTLTHTLLGGSLSRAGLDRFGGWVTPTLLVAANLPDAEIQLAFGDKANYLVYHRGITHSLVGLAVECVVLSVAVFALTRFGSARSSSPTKPGPPVRPAGAVAKFFTIMLVCAIGLLSHLALDGLNTYGVRPFLPFSEHWFYGDMLFIADPWTWLLLGGSVFVGSALNRWTRSGWALVCGFANALIVYGARNGLIPWSACAIWMAGAAILALIKWKPPGLLATPRAPRTLARAGLVIWALYLSLIFAASRNATLAAMEQHYQSYHSSEQVDKTSALPTPAVPWRFTIVLQTESQIYAYTADVLAAKVRFKERFERHLECAAAPSIQATRQYHAWQIFARHPCCQCNQNSVTLQDARFRAMGSDWTAFDLPLPDIATPPPNP